MNSLEFFATQLPTWLKEGRKGQSVIIRGKEVTFADSYVEALKTGYNLYADGAFHVYAIDESTIRPHSVSTPLFVS